MSEKSMEDYYNRIDSDKRLVDRIGRIEYDTTMKYILKYFPKGAKIVEVGACTGAYSIPLAREGYDVTAVELFSHNIEKMRGKLTANDSLNIIQGNAVDLSMLGDASFDGVLVLGPLYHLAEKDRLLAISEAKRICKKGGYLFCAYCLRDCQIVTLGFHEKCLYLKEWSKQNKINDQFDFVDEDSIFKYCSFKDIDNINTVQKLQRVELVATDAFCYYVKNQIDSWDEETYNKFVEYHRSICDVPYFAGTANHLLDILYIE